ncbi:MAG: hypothetical protein DHS20C21_06830 [Gemmatimonadota bacterium]|nr:MAG: hypothetical protein DHS20C21_06830 [Gemmatimonadota bacterium]
MKRHSSKKLFGILFGLPLILILPVALIGSSVYHAGVVEVEVLEKGRDGSSFSLVVPGAIFPVAMHFVPEWTVDDVRCELDEEALMALGIGEKAVRTLAAAADGVLVDVQTLDEIILIEKRNGAFRIHVDTPDETVRIQVPVGVAVDVLGAI